MLDEKARWTFRPEAQPVSFHRLKPHSPGTESVISIAIFGLLVPTRSTTAR